jgi:FkbM family methyltransferase
MFIPYKLNENGLGKYEPHGLDCFMALIEMAEPGAVFDIGANVGLYGLLAAAYSDRAVHCFEPAPDTAGIARATATTNDLDVTVAEIALGDDNGQAPLYLSDSTDSSNSLNPDFRAHSKEIVVPLETVDHYVARTGIVPSILKIDTETTEPEVLRGAEQLIREHRPWILAEVLWTKVEDRLHAVMDQFGYSYYHLNGPGPREATETIVGDQTWTYYMPCSPRTRGRRLLGAHERWRAALRPQRSSTRQRPTMAAPLGLRRHTFHRGGYGRSDSRVKDTWHDVARVEFVRFDDVGDGGGCRDKHPVGNDVRPGVK